MENQKLKVGDKVIWKKDKGSYIIAADKNTPREKMIVGNVFPSEGYDFIITDSLGATGKNICVKENELTKAN